MTATAKPSLFRRLHGALHQSEIINVSLGPEGAAEAAPEDVENDNALLAAHSKVTTNTLIFSQTSLVSN